MQPIIFPFLVTLLSLSHTTAHCPITTSDVAPPTYCRDARDNTACREMADEWIPIRNRGRGRGFRGRGGRQAPVVAGQGVPSGGSPIAARLSVQQGLIVQDNSFDTLIQVSYNHAHHNITVDLAHVKKVEVALKPRVPAPRPEWSPHFTALTADSSLECRRKYCTKFYHNILNYKKSTTTP